MPNTTRSPENAASWRELCDQLTPEQVATLEGGEQYHRATAASLPAGYPYEWPPRTESEIAGLLLEQARVYAGDNLGAKLIGDVGLPSGPAAGRCPTESRKRRRGRLDDLARVGALAATRS